MPSMPQLKVRAAHAAVALASAALFVSLDGPSHAAELITGADIKNNSVASKDIKNNSVKGGDLRDNSVMGDDVLESSLGKVPSATAADSAAAVAANSVTGAGVADRSLTAADISLAHGRLIADLPSTAANSCEFDFFALGPASLNLTKAAILVTPNAAIGDLDVSVTAVHSANPNAVRLVVCNPTAAAINPPSTDFDWIAFNVAP